MKNDINDTLQELIFMISDFNEKAESLLFKLQEDLKDVKPDRKS